MINRLLNFKCQMMVILVVTIIFIGGLNPSLFFLPIMQHPALGETSLEGSIDSKKNI